MLTVRASGTSYEQVWNMNIFIIRNINVLVHLFLMIFDTLVLFPFSKADLMNFKWNSELVGKRPNFAPLFFFW